MQGDINNTDIIQINIFSTYGQLIQLPNLNNISILPLRLNTTSLPKGIYFIEVITNNGKWNTTFVKIDN
ncbi:MAG: T9SS type A sorting domain-containing protein [Bacteroidetes bacterium]|nr:T9SS type A sorting domain-containing protein [Bacteroidota bacterium]